MGDIVKEILVRPIQLADQVTKSAEEAQSSKQDCIEIKSKTEKLAGLLRQAARASSELYERPTRRIIKDTEQVLDKALTLVLKCRSSRLINRVFAIAPAAAFKKMSSQLENSIGDVSWLLRVSVAADEHDDDYLGLPPIAANEPILCLIWEQIATLHKGSLDDRSDAAASLVSLARDNDRYGKLIIEEGGVAPLLKLVKEGKMEGQENAARAIGLLGRDPESVNYMIDAGVCSVFAKVLKEGHMKDNIIRLLVSHLAFETVQEHSKYAVATNITNNNNNKLSMSSIHSVMMANVEASKTSIISSNNKLEEDLTRIPAHPMGNQIPNQMQKVVANTIANRMVTKSSVMPPPPPLPPRQNYSANHHANSMNKSNLNAPIPLSGGSTKGREFEDPDTKAYMKAMAARALWQLAKGNAAICRSITESKALLCFAVLLEKGSLEVQYNSAMALMEITAVGEKNPDLRRSAFKPNSPAAKAVFDQLLRVIEKAEDSDLFIPCVISMGNLARTFRATETRIIGPLVRLLDEREDYVTREAAIALTKFACTENYLHVDHSKAIIDAGGAKHLIQLVYLGDQIVKIPSLVLLCYIAMNVPDSEALADAQTLTVLEWASKQNYMIQDPSVDAILPESKARLILREPVGHQNPIDPIDQEKLLDGGIEPIGPSGGQVSHTKSATTASIVNLASFYSTFKNQFGNLDIWAGCSPVWFSSQSEAGNISVVNQSLQRGMGDIVKEILARPIQLADRVTKCADEAQSSTTNSIEIKSKTEKLVGLLCQAARARSKLYERPTRRIMKDTMDQDRPDSFEAWSEI
ncbi:hypothetical protein Sjap_021683 [Stephania japonica]|uniref:DUF7792 domain-containing protein n=1 Tax=Stephania japonica TaxID=461633 RepID=A0AAP0EME3_9MAGN